MTNRGERRGHRVIMRVVLTPDDAAVAAGYSVNPAPWRELFDELMTLIAGRLGRAEPRRTAREFVLRCCRR